MVAYLFTNDGLPILEATGSVITLNSAGQTVDHIRNVLTITTANVFENYWKSPPISTPQPTIPIKVPSIVYFVTSKSVRTPKYPTTTSKFVRTPGCVNQKIIYYKTNAGEALYK